MKTNHAANLERHLMRIHAQEFGAVQLQKATSYPEPKFHISVPQHSVNIKVDDKRLMEACVELVVVNGCPIDIVEYSGFRKLIDPVVKGIGGDFQLNVDSLKSSIASMANDVVQKIKTAVRNNLLSLKIDVVTGLYGSILTVNVQYVMNGKLHLNTLSIKELVHDQTFFINDILLETLDVYNIDPNQIYSITFDSDSQMMDKSNCFSDRNTVEFNIPVIQNVHFNGTILAHKCVAVTLQLAIDDAHNDPNVICVLNEFRNFIKTIMSSLNLEEHNLHNLCSDSPSQWLTTYEMLEQFFEHSQEFLELAKSSSQFLISTVMWENLNFIYEGLKLLKHFSNVLKTDNLPMCDFFGLWLESKIRLEKLDNFYTNTLLKFMKERELIFMNNESFLASVYLDPRYQLLLSMEQKMQARIHLEQVWENVQATSSLVEKDIKECVNDFDMNTEMDVEDEIEKMLKMKEMERDMKQFVQTDKINQILLGFDGVTRIARKENILRYWACAKGNHPELYELVKIVYGIPASFVTLERTLSILKNIHYKSEDGLVDSNTENILLIKLNHEIS